MAVEKNISQPTRSYRIQLLIQGIKETDFDLKNVNIVSSLASAWQVVTLDVFVDPKLILRNKIYGQNFLKLSIILLGDTEEQQNRLDLELIAFGINFDVAMSEQLATGVQSDRTLLKITAIPKKTFETMTTFVNAVYCVKDSPVTPIEIVGKLKQDFVKTGATIIYDSDKVNTELIYQICVPPITLYKAIEYIDRDFSLYDGNVSTTFCQYDNKVYIMDLTNRMKKSHSILIVQPSIQGSEADEKYIESASKGKKFYTYDNIKVSYGGNVIFSKIGNSIRHIVNPRDDLYVTISQELQDIISNYAIIDKNKNIPIIDSVSKRKKYYIDHGGFDRTDQYANSLIAKKIYDMTRISMLLERNIILDELLKVGSIVKFKSYTNEHVSLSGKYILFMSDITWSKRVDWETVARVELVRSNNTIL